MFVPQDRRPLLPLDRRDAAFAVRQALGMRHHGPVQDKVDATLQGEIAELIADALNEAGYVVAIKQRRAAPVGWPMFERGAKRPVA
ncbi:hypothetical protein NFI95_10385 [Acetobacteraceae bacterium KSS8]|uniref:Uncharacterized protein n=1 Tax=Endosaccharibacter trunci TaxID=2812733 RepID=A0ABT1W7J9_9PROT|nr:hypothetical protein [Acetobacteraceae bacterium KSS8]